MKELETKTGQPAPYFFLLFSVLLIVFVSIVGGMKLLSDVLGFFYPAYMSFKSLESKTEDSWWLKYWVVFSTFCIVEKVFGIVLMMIPMYYILKLVFIVWMWYPSTKGALILYETALRPVAAPYLEKFSKAE